jgi:hypothetical protein
VMKDQEVPSRVPFDQQKMDSKNQLMH